MKCPRCQAKIDVTDLSAGSTVRCPDCGGMVRLPSGSTGQYASVPATAAAPPPRPAGAAAPAAPQRQTSVRGRTTKVRAAGGGRQTNLFRKMSNVRAPGEKGRAQIASESGMERGGARNSGPSAGVIVGIAVGALVVIGVVAYALMGQKGEGTGGKKDREETSARSGRKDRQKEPKVALNKAAFAPSAPAENFATFQPGARALVDKATMPPMDTNPLVKSEYESLAAGNVAGVVAQDQRFFIYIIDGMLSDNEPVARGSMQAMHDIIVKRGFAKDVQAYTQLARDSVIPQFNVPSNRTQEYGYWAMWWFTATSRNLVGSWGPVDPSSSSGAVSARPITNVGGDSWDATMQALRSGGGFDSETSPEYGPFQRVKAMGPAAYPNLIKYIDHEDIMLGRAAVAILKALTKNNESKMPNESNKTEVKAYWEGWIKSNPVK
jgi:hypothetical protein